VSQDLEWSDAQAEFLRAAVRWRTVALRQERVEELPLTITRAECWSLTAIQSDLAYGRKGTTSQPQMRIHHLDAGRVEAVRKIAPLEVGRERLEVGP
jgi:hypothetical protein